MKQKMFVLGAGSSKDIYGDFYSGAELFHMVVHYFFPQRKSNGIGYVSDMMNQISSNAVANISDDELLLIREKLWERDAHDYVQVIRKSSHTTYSIDKFIKEDLGKLRDDLRKRATIWIKASITHLIKGMEYAYFESEKKFSQYQNSWIYGLIKHAEGIGFENFCRRFCFVIFNYDRLFEWCFMKYYQGSDFDMTALRGIVHHPYGSLGALVDVPFDKNNNERGILQKALGSMTTMYERSDSIDIDLFNEFAERFDLSHIFFMGFGYDKFNLRFFDKILKNPDILKSGTGRNLSDELKVLLNGKSIETVDMYCRMFYDGYIKKERHYY